MQMLVIWLRDSSGTLLITDLMQIQSLSRKQRSSGVSGYGKTRIGRVVSLVSTIYDFHGASRHFKVRAKPSNLRLPQQPSQNDTIAINNYLNEVNN
jgi:hypothetical protein